MTKRSGTYSLNLFQALALTMGVALAFAEDAKSSEQNMVFLPAKPITEMAGESAPNINYVKLNKGMVLVRQSNDHYYYKWGLSQIQSRETMVACKLGMDEDTPSSKPATVSISPGWFEVTDASIKPVPNAQGLASYTYELDLSPVDLLGKPLSGSAKLAFQCASTGPKNSPPLNQDYLFNSVVQVLCPQTDPALGPPLKMREPQVQSGTADAGVSASSPSSPGLVTSGKAHRRDF